MNDILARYIQTALAGANYECARGGEFCGEIPGFYGLRASGKTKEDCEQQLRAALEDWLNYRSENDLSIPSVGGFRIVTSGLEMREEQLDKLSRLEDELQSLKVQLGQEPNRSVLLVGGIRRANSWYKSYWQILVSLASIGIIVIAYIFYGVDPIESYREVGDRIAMAAKYVAIGDELLLRSGSRSPEAVKAYEAALAVYPSNMNARHGLLKATILDPEPGRDEYDIGIAKTKLTTARAYIGQDYYLSYVEGNIALKQALTSREPEQSRFAAEAKRAFEKSQQLNPEFPGNYLQLGYLELYSSRPRAALAIFEAADKSGRSSPLILTYLGSLNASYRKFDEAIAYLTKANSLATRLDTLIVLGDVYRYKADGFLDAAINRHKEALKMAERTNLVRGVDYDEILYTYMPKKAGEPDDADLFPRPFSTQENLKVLANYSLSLDHILKGEEKLAEAAFNAGFALDACYGTGPKKEKQFTRWYKNQVTYLTIEPSYGLSAETQKWLEAKTRQLESCQ
jgi:predicted RNase H-like HicB family nuclease